MTWKLKRTAQCEKCPWRKEVDPHDIPNGYCETKHATFVDTLPKKLPQSAVNKADEDQPPTEGK